MENRLKIMAIEQETPDTKRFILVKPRDFSFIPGRAVMVAINKPGLENLKRPFTFISLNTDYYIEFIFREYPKHDRFSENIRNVKAGEELILSDTIGSMEFKGNGVFIASGIGILPFISIFRQLNQGSSLIGNTLIYIAKTKEELILERELKHLLDKRCFIILTRENSTGYEIKRIDAEFLKEKIQSLSQQFYISGPESFVNEIKKILEELGAKEISTEISE